MHRMDEKHPDLISRIATYGSVVLVPLLLWFMGGWKPLAILFGMALLAGILAAYVSRNETDEDDPGDGVSLPVRTEHGSTKLD